MGLERGKQSGFYIPLDEDKSFYSTFTAGRSDGLGYSLNYIDGNSIFNPNSGTIGFGSKVLKNFYLGASWNKYTKNEWYEINDEKISKTWIDNTIQIGALYRPFNFLSFGINLTMPENLENIQNHQLGLSFRPFLKHRLTFGSDVSFIRKEHLDGCGDDGDKECIAVHYNRNIMPFISIQPFNGIQLSASTFLDDDDSFK